MKKIHESLAYCIASVTLLFLCFKTQAQDSLNVYHIKYRYLFTADDPTAKPTEAQEELMNDGDLEVYFAAFNNDPKYKVFRGDSLTEIGWWETMTKFVVFGGRATKIVGAMVSPDEVVREGESLYLWPSDFNYEYKEHSQTILGKSCQVMVARPKKGGDEQEFWFTLNADMPTIPWYYFGFLQSDWYGGLLQAMRRNNAQKSSFGIRAIAFGQLRVPHNFFELPTDMPVEELHPPMLR